MSTEETTIESNPEKSVISLKNANIYQEKSLILNKVDLNVNSGEFVYLIGKT